MGFRGKEGCSVPEQIQGSWDGSPKISPLQIPQNLLCVHQNLSCWHSLDTSSLPGDLNTEQSRSIMYPWTSGALNINNKSYLKHLRKLPLSSGFVPSEAHFQHCLVYWTLFKNGNSPGSIWHQDWAAGKDFSCMRRWFCTRGSEHKSSARDSVWSPMGKGKSGCRPWSREQLLLEMDLSGLGWRKCFGTSHLEFVISFFSHLLHFLYECFWVCFFFLFF